MSDIGNLTSAGWPRPIVGGLPIPWVSPSDDLSRMNVARAAACASGAICAVCGGDYGDDEDAYVLVEGADQPAAIADVDVQAMDNGILHKRCLQLALSRCPKLRQLRIDGRLQVVRTKGNAANPIVREAKVHAVISGEECETVDFEALK